MKKLLAMVMALMMVMGTIAFASAEEAPTSATAWLLYFASNHEKDSANFPWWPQHQRVDQPASETGVEYTNAQVTGPGKYTVGLKFNWQKAEGAIQFNLIINDAEVLFPGYYVDITDIRVNGESIPMNENYYGTYHDDTNSGMVPLYNSYWDPFFTPDAVGPQNYRSFDGTPEDATHMVINPDDIVNGDTIEVDFVFAAEAGAAPAELGEMPEAGVQLDPPAEETIPENATKARLYFSDYGYWPSTDGATGESTEVTITGEGHYTLSTHWLEQSWGMPSGGYDFSEGAFNEGFKLQLIVDDGGNGATNVMAGKYLGIADVRVNGVSVDFGNVAYGPTGYNNGNVFDSNDGYAILYDQWMVDNQGTDVPWGHKTWDGSTGSVDAVDLKNVGTIHTVEVDFFVTSTQNVVPSTEENTDVWYNSNTVGLAGLSLKDLGIAEDWHNIVPVDVSETGYQVFTLVGADAHEIGHAFVAVNNGAVTVTCEYAGGPTAMIIEHSQCIKWFTSLEDITAEALTSTEGGVACGEAVNLDGTVYLSINNKVSWRSPINADSANLPRYWRNSPSWVAYRENLKTLLPAE